jgi:hypothetical protein
MTRTLLRAVGALVVAALLVGPSAQAHAPHATDRPTTGQHTRPAYGHTTNEWLMMGRACGASMTGT